MTVLLPDCEFCVMRAHPDAFLHSLGKFTCEVGGKLIPGYQCKYYAAAYRDCLFDHFAITFPGQLKRAVAKRRSDYLAGRFCAKQLLKLLGLDDPRPDVLIGRNREPIWPEGVVGSISHSENLAVSVATDEPDVLGLGVDIEQEIHPDIVDDIKRLIVDAEEDKFIRSHFQVYNQGVTVVFSAKESVYKAIYPLVGRFFDFFAIRVVRVDADQIVFAVADSLSEHFKVGALIHVNYRVIGRKVFTVTCMSR